MKITFLLLILIPRSSFASNIVPNEKFKPKVSCENVVHNPDRLKLNQDEKLVLGTSKVSKEEQAAQDLADQLKLYDFDKTSRLKEVRQDEILIFSRTKQKYIKVDRKDFEALLLRTKSEGLLPLDKIIDMAFENGFGQNNDAIKLSYFARAPFNWINEGYFYVKENSNLVRIYKGVSDQVEVTKAYFEYLDELLKNNQTFTFQMTFKMLNALRQDLDAGGVAFAVIGLTEITGSAMKNGAFQPVSLKTSELLPSSMAPTQRNADAVRAAVSPPPLTPLEYLIKSAPLYSADTESWRRWAAGFGVTHRADLNAVNGGRLPFERWSKSILDLDVLLTNLAGNPNINMDRILSTLASALSTLISQDNETVKTWEKFLSTYKIGPQLRLLLHKVALHNYGRTEVAQWTWQINYGSPNVSSVLEFGMQR